ncbi:MAG: thiamine pyrophosphate-binding protein [Solirubrobacterales bacterium]
MRVADYIAEFLHAQGVREIFMLSGTGSIHLDDAFARHDDIEFYCARHEGAAAMMAVGCAKLSERLGVAVVTTGPGGTNAISGVVEGWVDSVPMLVLSGQVANRWIGSTRSFGVQGFEIVPVVHGFTKYAARVEDPATIGDHLGQAVAAACSGRPGPAWLDVPADVQAAEIDAAPAAGAAAPAPGGDHGPELERRLDQAAELMREAERPLIVIGQGLRQRDALPAFMRLRDELGAPVISSRMAADLMPLASDLFLGQGGTRGRRGATAAMRECDFVLSLGCSLAHSLLGDEEELLDGARIAMVDIDPDEMAKPGLRVEVPIRADVGLAIEGLLARWRQGRRPDWSDWANRCRRREEELPTVLPEQRGDPINTYHFVEELERRTERHNVFVSDAGGAYYATGQALRFERGQRELTSAAFASMGVSLSLAVGAAVADPGAQVLVVTGDGSIETNIQELQTIAQYGLGIKVFVLNNGGYASIRDTQDAMCGGLHTDLHPVLDFARIATAFDLPYRRIDSSATMPAAIAELLTEDGPALIEVVCDPEQEMITPAAELAEIADRSPA